MNRKGRERERISSWTQEGRTRRKENSPTNVEHPPSISCHSRCPRSSKHESFLLDDLMRHLSESSFRRGMRDETGLSDFDELIFRVGREVDSFHSCEQAREDPEEERMMISFRVREGEVRRLRYGRKRERKTRKNRETHPSDSSPSQPTSPAYPSCWLRQ